jgi:drug/metabolite transporter (DMT)-like permease
MVYIWKNVTNPIDIMLRGIVIVITACIIWGLIYVIPLFMSEFNPLEIAIGRYFCYGVVSILYMVCFRRTSLFQTPKPLWKKAFLFSFLANIGFYPAAVLGIQYADAAISALILGMTPITIAVMGNLKQKECRFRSLLWPCLAIAIGLLLVNAPALMANSFEKSIHLYCIGLFFAFIALISWSLFAVANGRLLKKYPNMSSRDWSSIIGIASGVWVLIILTGLFIFTPGPFFYKFLVWTPELQSFLIGSLVLGLLCSWVGAFLWNKGSSMLPIPLAGQLTIFETLFGLLFVFMMQKRVPVAVELAGISIILVGIYASIRLFSKAAPPAAPTTEQKTE